MTQLENTIRKTAAIKGLILGLILLAMSIIFYYMLISGIMVGTTIIIASLFFSFIIPIGIALLFGFNLRKSIGGYWTFRQATTGMFIMFAICYVMQVVGKDVVFARLVEPDMVKKTQAAMMDASTVMWKKSGAKQADIDQKKADIQKEFNDQSNITVGGIIQSYVITLIFLFLFALIFAAMLKKNPPEYSSVQ